MRVESLTEWLDEDQDPFAWSLVTAPRGVSLDALSGRLRWTPTADQMGAQPVVVKFVVEQVVNFITDGV